VRAGEPEAQALWGPFLDEIRADPNYRFAREVQIHALPARHLWDAEFLKQHAPATLVADGRPAAPAHHFLWAGDADQVGVFLHAYRSAYLPARLLAAEQQSALADAVNPEALEAFALAICAGGGPPAYAGMPAPDFAAARVEAVVINRAMEELLRVAPAAGSYVSESNYFEAQWQTSFWGPNYGKLAAVKRAYDPEGLFWVHHGVGSEAWSDDGSTPRTA
jgi:hypothetical protein